MGAPREALAALLEQAGTRVEPPILLPANPFFDLAGEEFGRRLLLTQGSDGVEYCLRPDFTLPIARRYLDEGAVAPAAFAYLGPIFRQRNEGPAQFDQAGVELLGQPDPDTALDSVFAFARAALSAFGVERPAVHLGSVALFEAILNGVEMPDVWRPRIRTRFGHPEAMARLLDRLEDPHGANGYARMPSRAELVDQVTEQMYAAGLPLTGGRSPEEIADRYIEKQALAQAHIPGETLRLLRDYLALSGPAEEVMKLAGSLAQSQAISCEQPLNSLAFHLEVLREAGLGEITFDAGFSPRLDYYTGIVFEMRGTGSVLASGGQYDRLLTRLGAKNQIAAAGCAVWVDRLEREANR